MVHGFTGAKEDFADHADELAAEGWHVVAPDLRGHGLSAHPAGEDNYSLGLFAPCRLLPRPMFAAAVWYLTTGLACLAFANGTHAFSPWAMALPYGVGQLFIAGVLYRSSGAADVEG